jgi:hypothetical protein
LIALAANHRLNVISVSEWMPDKCWKMLHLSRIVPARISHPEGFADHQNAEVNVLGRS